MTLEERIRQGTPVTLEQMLDARERRAATQRRLLNEYGGTLICFTMNMPGEYKTYPLARRAFRCGQSMIDAQLSGNQIEILTMTGLESEAGCEAYYAVNADGARAKALMAAIEQGHPLGRLFDIDVLDRDGRAVKGADIGREERRCIVCGGPVWACARSRAHTAEQLALKTAGLIEDYFSRQYADQISGAAVRALLYEVCVTPKPGLVDRANNGAHRDMDIFTFVDSSAALTPYFREITHRAIGFEGDIEALLPALRYEGLRAEQAMLAATGGVNTHKGLIFSIGILCAAMGWLYGRERPPTAEALFATCARIAGGTPRELAVEGRRAATYGEAAFQGYGVTGARGEAARGFPAVREHGHPALKHGVAQGLSLNDAGVVTLLHLMIHVTDTNLIGRSSLQRLEELQTELRALLGVESDPARLLEYAAGLDRALIAEYLSPGGCADMLALSLLVYFLFDEKSDHIA